MLLRLHQRRFSAAPIPLRCGTLPTTRAPSPPARRSSPYPASAPTGMTSRSRRSRTAPSHSSSSVRSSRKSRSFSCRRHGLRWRPPRTRSSGSPPASSRSPASRERAGRRRPRTSCTPCWRPPAGGPVSSARSRAASVGRCARWFGQRRRRSTSSARSARCSTPAIAAWHSRRRHTRRCCTGSTASGSTRSCSRT